MKLLFCKSCTDIVRPLREWKPCLCGESSGRYTGEFSFEYKGPAVLIGIHNSRLFELLQDWPEDFTEGVLAWAIPNNHEDIEKVDART